MKDAQIELSKEECASSMEQRGNYAAVMDAQSKPSVAEYVGGTAQTAIHTMNLPHLGQNSIRLLQHKPFPTSVVLELPSEDDKMDAEEVTILCQEIIEEV